MPNLPYDSQSSSHADDDVQPVSFAELGVPNPLVAALADDGKTSAFPIQADTLPDSLAGRDLLGRGRTGSGKTLAFAIPMVARLGSEDMGASAMKEARRARDDSRGGRSRGPLPHPRGLVLEPTRELANQVDEVIRSLAEVYGMRTATVYGGVNQSRQVRELRAGADIVVACPGRLEDLLRQGLLSLESVEVTVLDEADEMADMGFLPAVERLLSQVDPEGQRMLFSATLDHGVDQVVRKFLHDAKVHAVDSADAQVDTMTHHVFAVSQGNKHEVIRQLASGTGRRILFTRTKYQAKNMAHKLVQMGIPAVDLQGNLSQSQRDRHLAAFTSGEVRVMVATDVAARGIDVSDVELVVQTEPPEDPKSFLHRSGRTARAGESGDVVTLVLPQQQRDARQMLRRAGIHVNPVQVTPGSEEIEKLVGEHAPLVEDWELSSAPVARGQGHRGGGSRSRRGSRGSRAGSRFVRDDERGGRGRGDGPRHEGSDRREDRGGSGDRRRDGYRGSRDDDGRRDSRGYGRGRGSRDGSAGDGRTERTERRSRYDHDGGGRSDRYDGGRDRRDAPRHDGGDGGRRSGRPSFSRRSNSSAGARGNGRSGGRRGQR